MAPVNANIITDKVYREQIALLYIKPPGRALLHFFPAIIIYLLVMEYTGVKPVALIWLGLLMLFNGLRFIDISIIQEKIQVVTDFRMLEKRFALGCALVGMTYGAGLYLLLPQLPQLNQVAILAVVISVIPGAMVSFSTSKISFLFYFLPALGLPVAQCLLIGNPFHIYIAIFGCTYMYLVITLFNWNYDLLTEAINLRLANHELVISLTGSNRQLEALSTIDSLTNLSNRRHFDDILERELLRAQRAGTPISLIMLDIDFFKQYNDEYGHLAGDNCLRFISTVLQENVKRPGDMVARYGGEEFCIIMPDTDQQGALILAGKIQKEVVLLNIHHAKSSIADHVTVSIGTATTVPGFQVTANMLINAADKALYTAKKGGRNLIRSSNITAV